MLSSPAFKKAFDLSSEPAAVRDRYGRTTYGQGCLLARRLVEAGARFINVYMAQFIGGCEGGWDTHGFNAKPMYPILKKYLLPLADQTLPTLLDDLDDRGLLDTTLVVWVGEFGRSPRINNLAGRDHWPQCYPAPLAGGAPLARLRLVRQERRLSCQRPGMARRPIGHYVPSSGHRPEDRGPGCLESATAHHAGSVSGSRVLA